MGCTYSSQPSVAYHVPLSVLSGFGAERAFEETKMTRRFMVLVLAILCWPASARAQQVTSVVVDATNNRLTASGSNLNSVVGATLGATNLTVISASATQVVAGLPSP